jgi:hypothetical protein
VSDGDAESDDRPEYPYIRFVHEMRSYADYLWRQGYRGVSRGINDRIKALWKELDEDAPE